MEQLTPKQINARAYYQANRDKICAQKRAGYAPKRLAKVLTKPLPKIVNVNAPVTKSDIEWDRTQKKCNKFNSVINDGEEFKTRSVINGAITLKDKNALSTRRRLEDIKQAREMGLSMDDLS